MAASRPPIDTNPPNIHLITSALSVFIFAFRVNSSSCKSPFSSDLKLFNSSFVARCEKSVSLEALITSAIASAYSCGTPLSRSWRAVVSLSNAMLFIDNAFACFLYHTGMPCFQQRKNHRPGGAGSHRTLPRSAEAAKQQE